jgi:cell division topological specificity factor
MSLFSDLYNTLAKFFKQQEDTEDASKSVATNRLKLVLMQDRTNLTPRILEQMRSELIELLSRYVELDKELLDLNFEQEGDQVALMLSIPVIRAKDEEEIDAAIRAREELLKTTAKAEETVDVEEEITDETTEGQTLEITDEQDDRTEEEKTEADKADAIAKELNEVPKIIKKNKVSSPENMNNPFKNETTETTEKVETSTEA